MEPFSFLYRTTNNRDVIDEFYNKPRQVGTTNVGMRNNSIGGYSRVLWSNSLKKLNNIDSRGKMMAELALYGDDEDFQ